MEDKNYLSDEQLAGFLADRLSESETHEVLDRLSQQDESVEDLLNIAAAIELHSQTHQQLSKQIPWWARRSTWSAAAAMILLLGGSVFFFVHLHRLGVESAPVYASHDTLNQDTITSQELTYTLIQE